MILVMTAILSMGEQIVEVYVCKSMIEFVLGLASS
jgi:hypothetical protein